MSKKTNNNFSKLTELISLMIIIQILASIWMFLRIYLENYQTSFFNLSKSNLLSYVIQVIIQGCIMLFLLNLEKKNPKILIALFILIGATYLGRLQFIPDISIQQSSQFGLKFDLIDGIQWILSIVLFVRQIRYSNQIRERKQYF